MKTQVIYRGVDKSSFIDRFIEDKAHRWLDVYLKREPDAWLKVRLHSECARTAMKHAVYSCEALLKTRGRKNPFKVHRVGKNFHEVVVDALTSIETCLQKKLSHRPKHHKKLSKTFTDLEDLIPSF